MVYVTIYGPPRVCTLVQFIGDMLIEGVYFVINMLARGSRLLGPFLSHYCILALSFLISVFGASSLSQHSFFSALSYGLFSSSLVFGVTFFISIHGFVGFHFLVA